MAGPYEWLIGTRHLRSTHRRGFVSFVALISVMGLTLGVATLVVVLSVMNGFERELRTRILSVTSHAMLMGIHGRIDDWREVQQAVEREPGVIAAAPYIEAQALLAYKKRVKGVMVRGVLPKEEARTTTLGQHLTAGALTDLKDGAYNVILGINLAKELRANVGDDIVIIAPEGTATPSGVVPRMRRFHVTGTFQSGMFEYDNTLALIHMQDAARLYKLGDAVSGVRMTLQDPMRSTSTLLDLMRKLGSDKFNGSDWTRTHVNFFRAIQTTKSMMFIILLMIVAVAAFNIVSTLVMIVKEKQSDIAILRTIGVGPKNILAMFAVQGTLIGLAGTVIGASLGILLAHNIQSIISGIERVFGVQFMDASVYFMSELPAYVEMGDVIRICVVAFVLCALATIYPAWRASRTAPAEALRHD
ncbi:MAG: lipoprotein-releasing ABC transporter permease subunit [Gammaproteobacteria bacterium]